MYRIRTRLIFAILLAALVPAIPMSVVVGDLLSRSLNPALHAELTDGLEAGLAESRAALAARKADFLVAAQRALEPLHRPNPSSVLPTYIELDAEGRVTETSAREGRIPPEQLDATPRLVDGYLAVRFEHPTRPQPTPVVIVQPVPAEVADRAAQLSEAISLLAAYRLERASILRSYVLPFLLVYGVLIGIALAVAIVVSNGLARPIEDLARAAARVADGDLAARVSGPRRGEVGELVSAFNDMVSRLRQQRAELSRLEKMSAWRDMARVLAHEIKNPLTPILLAVQQTRTSYGGDDRAHAEMLSDCESIVTEEVESLRGLVRSFSDFARPLQPEPKPVCILELVHGLARLYGDRLEIAEECVVRDWVLDADMIKRALINLIDNGLTACERAGAEPKVRIVVTDAGNAMQIEVIDQGAGVEADLRERIFEPDFTTGSQGMGLGLPIVAGIVEAHGGMIRLLDQDDGGACFLIDLPVPKEMV